MKTENKNLLMNILFVLATLIGIVLFFNRYISPNFLPNNNFRILTDHFFQGFLVPLWFYILGLGINSFFDPSRKIEYNPLWFIIFTIFALLIPFFSDGLDQGFKDIDQIVVGLGGIILSWVYFLKFRKIKLSLMKQAFNGELVR
jgi:hypothetical protein